MANTERQKQTKWGVILFYILEFTWGLPLTLIGLLVSLVLMICGKKVEKFGPTFTFPIGQGYGLELFYGSISSTNGSFHTKCHEFGHAIQNSIMGIFTLFLVFLPSVARYWLYEIKKQIYRYIYAYVILLDAKFIGYILSRIGIACNIWPLFILGCIITIYFYLLCFWLIVIEIPKFKTEEPEYDSVWFEKTASEWGTNFIKKHYPNQK